MARDYEYELDITAETRDLDRAEQAVRDLEEALDGTDDTARSALQVLGAMADDLEAELKGTASAADALKVALGDAFDGDSARVERMVQDLRGMGLEFEQIEANAKEFADVMQRADGIKLDAINSGLTNVGGSLNRVRDSGDQSRSVLANLAGNAAQDLGELGGVVGSLGVGIGQLAEYAVDGNISLSNLAKVAGPMLGLAGALALINKEAAENQAEAEAAAEAINTFREAVEELGPTAEAAAEGLAELFDKGVKPEDVNLLDTIGQAFLGLGDDIVSFLDTEPGAIVDMPAFLGSLGVSLADVSAAMAGGEDAWNAFLDALVNDFRVEGVSDDLENQLGAAFEAYSTATNSAANRSAFFADSLEGVQTAIAGVNREGSQVSEAWEVLLTDMADGVLSTEASAEAWNFLRETLGLSKEELAERLNQKVAEKLQEEADATDDATEAARDHVQAILDTVEAFAEVQSAIDDVGASLGSIADRGDALSTVLARIAEAGELTQSREIVDFADGLNTLSDAIDELSGADLEGLDLVPDNWAEVQSMPEELRPVLDALSGFAGQVQSEMSQAFDAGGEAGVLEWAANTRQAVIDALPADLADEQVEQILSALGLLPPQVEIAIELSNQERARGVLDEISAAVESLPTDVQLQIAAVAQTDPIAALQLAIDSLAAQGHEIPVELVALMDELNGDVEGYVPPPVAVPVEGDMLPVTKSIDDLTGEEKTVVVKGEADVDEVERDLDETAKERTSPLNINIVQYVVALALMQALASPRTAVVTAEAHTFAAENDLDAAAAARSAPVDMFVRQRVTASDLTNIATGGQRAVRIPIDMYVRNSPRLEGRR